MERNETYSSDFTNYYGNSIEKYCRPFYFMNYYGDCGYVDNLLQGAANLEEFVAGCEAFVVRNTDGDVIYTRRM